MPRRAAGGRRPVRADRRRVDGGRVNSRASAEFLVAFGWLRGVSFGDDRRAKERLTVVRIKTFAFGNPSYFSSARRRCVRDVGQILTVVPTEKDDPVAKETILSQKSCPKT